MVVQQEWLTCGSPSELEITFCLAIPDRNWNSNTTGRPNVNYSWYKYLIADFFSVGVFFSIQAPGSL